MSTPTTSTPSGSTISPQTRRASAHADLQAISGDYYNVTDAEGAPLAGLLVLLDRKERPVRAELHLADTISAAESEMAVRQANLLLKERYTGTAPLKLFVLRAQLEDLSTSVELDSPPPPSRIPSWLQRAGALALAVLVTLALGWFLNDLLTGASAPEQTGGNQSAPVAQPQDISEPVTESSAPSPGGTDADRIFETNDLPASRNAMPMDVGQRAQIQPGYSITVRTEPGAEAGQVAGYLQNGAGMEIVNGPVWLQGNSDTIVWWYVRLDDGTEGWVPANTSELTLLRPAE